MTERTIIREDPRLSHRGEWMAVQYANHLAHTGKIPSSDEIIRELHEKIMRPVFNPEFGEIFAGRYRYTDVRISYAGFEVPRGRDVDSKMAEYVEDIDKRVNALKKGPRDVGDFVEFASHAHYHLVTIHPFVDGNGRTARQFINFWCKRFGVKQFLLGPVHKHAYIDALEKVNMTENLDHFTIFLATNLWNRYTRGRTESDKEYASFLNDKIMELNWRIRTAPKSKR